MNEHNLKRLDPFFIIYRMLLLVRKTVIFFFLFKAINVLNINVTVKWFFILIFLWSVGAQIFGATMHWFSFRYHISKDILIIQKGFFFKKTLSVPVSSSQKMLVNQSIIYKIFHKYSVLFEVKSDDAKEVRLETISHDEYNELMALNILKEEASTTFKNKTYTNYIYRTRNIDIIKNSISSIQLVSIYISFFSYIMKQIKLYFRQFYGNNNLLIITIIIVLIATFIYSYILQSIKYRNFKLVNKQHELILVNNLFESHSSRMHKNEISALVIKTNIIKKMFNLFRVEAIIFSGRFADAQTKEQRVIIPFISEKNINKTLSQIFGNRLNLQGTINSSFPPLIYVTTKIILHSTIIIILLMVNTNKLVILLFCTIIIIRNFQKCTSGIKFNSNVVFLKIGFIFRKTFIIEKKDIEEIKIFQNFFQKIFKIQTLKISFKNEPIKKIKIYNINNKILDDFMNTIKYN